MCNPGGAAALLSLGNLMCVLGDGNTNHAPTLHALEEAAGKELGVVRISFGLASCWADVWRVRCWVLKALKDGWVIHSSSVGPPAFGISDGASSGSVGRAI